MNELVDSRPKRKVLSLKLQDDTKPEKGTTPKKYLHEDISYYMVWTPDGDMPKRVYCPDEGGIAISHAKKLAQETGRRFYVMRSWRGFDPS